MKSYDVPVLVVGGSLVGMTTAMLLAKQGVKSLVVEKHPGSAIHPRAALMLQRSMEIFRSAGVEDEMRTRSFNQFEPDGAIMAVETMAGKEIAWYMTRVNDGVRDLSPSERIFVTQIAVEPVLKGRAEELGAEVLFGTELVSVTEDADGVSAVIRDRTTSEESNVRAKYLIAADGPHSTVREQLGITRSGHGVLSKSITIYFRADIEPLLKGRNLSVIMVVNDVLQGFFRFEKPYQSGFLVVHGLGDPQRPNSDLWTGLSDESCIEMVRAGLGVDDIPVEINNVMQWEATAVTADEFRRGRTFLVGDAAHEMPPYGGYGGNTGIHDAHNLAWKLAAVLNGSAGEDLLSSYDAERRPAAAFTVEQGYSRFVVRAAPYRAADGIEPVVPDANIDLGYRYRSSAVIADANDDGAIQSDPRELHGLPGSRAPHYELTLGGKQVSTLDFFNRNFVLFTGADAKAWRESGEAAGRELGLDLDLYTVDAVADPAGGFAESYGITSTGAVLVRPDGFVAWRAETDAGADQHSLSTVLGTVLGRAVA
ncbi:MAG TPA: FAD-dependent monooxygenase [Actinomycetes bacterium]|nr:FAD-dependent monooxygenase [Actinomycetes bacterium]